MKARPRYVGGVAQLNWNEKLRAEGVLQHGSAKRRLPRTIAFPQSVWGFGTEALASKLSGVHSLRRTYLNRTAMDRCS
ncbi:hypothetical protein DSM104635_01330 [Terricaulis silvestris]|uniref:Uncharacterized protein n=1 Tax=Terricaulis silvestris TaxID=2686094 RepID=A0A6I6MKK3_9CAUL|nr:hypothetical protein DSM104635_01330 [Terricaulis silvestris]